MNFNALLKVIRSPRTTAAETAASVGYRTVYVDLEGRPRPADWEALVAGDYGQFVDEVVDVIQSDVYRDRTVVGVERKRSVVVPFAELIDDTGVVVEVKVKRPDATDD